MTTHSQLLLRVVSRPSTVISGGCSTIDQIEYTDTNKKEENIALISMKEKNNNNILFFSFFFFFWLRINNAMFVDSTFAKYLWSAKCYLTLKSYLNVERNCSGCLLFYGFASIPILYTFIYLISLLFRFIFCTQNPDTRCICMFMCQTKVPNMSIWWFECVRATRIRYVYVRVYVCGRFYVELQVYAMSCKWAIYNILPHYKKAHA